MRWVLACTFRVLVSCCRKHDVHKLGEGDTLASFRVHYEIFGLRTGFRTGVFAVSLPVCGPFIRSQHCRFLIEPGERIWGTSKPVPLTFIPMKPRLLVLIHCIVVLVLAAHFSAETLNAAVVTRGPYLQMGGPDSIVVRWRTDTGTDSRVRYGSSPSSLNLAANNSLVTTEHEVLVSGLSPDTQYFYSVGTSTATLAGGDSTYFWITFPPVGTPAPTRIWVLGDSGTADSSATAVRNAYLNATG